VLPGTVTVVVPGLILLLGSGPSVGWGLGAFLSALAVALGTALIASGLLLWAWTVRLLARIGKGTLAPWDPTRELVVAGPYRHVRNPMIVAVLVVLMGEGLLLGSPGVAAWAILFFASNAVFFAVVEEPGLERRFGDEYRLYKGNVPRWWPRGTPWSPS
jgi:protein-S-isoprenylcysteine O-methyltransferase Ste14